MSTPRARTADTADYLSAAVTDDADEIAALHAASALDLTARFGRGHWSLGGSLTGVLRSLKRPGLFVARDGARIVASLHLVTKKPWAIDTAYFTPCETALYLIGMVVAPDAQRRGIGKRCLDDVARIARAWPADAIRLDAYDGDVGAGDFYAKCGWREVGRASYRGQPLIYFEWLLTSSPAAPKKRAARR